MSPCLIDWGEVIPQNVLMLSRKVDKCKPQHVGDIDGTVFLAMTRKARA
jgi:hypothetical protein